MMLLSSDNQITLQTITMPSFIKTPPECPHGNGVMLCETSSISEESSFECVALEQGRHFRAFSLVEVVLALGLVSFAMVAVLGLLPVGLSTFRQAMDQTVESQIAQKIHGEMLLTQFSALTSTYEAKTHFFNDEGQPVNLGGVSKYRVTTSLADVVFPGWSNAVYPGTTTPAEALARNIQGVRIDIVKTQGATQTNRFTVQVPNSGN